MLVIGISADICFWHLCLTCWTDICCLLYWVYISALTVVTDIFACRFLLTFVSDMFYLRFCPTCWVDIGYGSCYWHFCLTCFTYIVVWLFNWHAWSWMCNWHCWMVFVTGIFVWRVELAFAFDIFSWFCFLVFWMDMCDWHLLLTLLRVEEKERDKEEEEWNSS